MKNREVVRGAKDFLPREAALKRQLENQTVQTFLSWGYKEVVTPTFEYLEVIEAGAGDDIREELFLLQDRDGRLLALRPEMTIPIARLVTTKFMDSERPLRLFYNANIFRHTQPQMGRYMEFYQLGVELVGASGVMADAEVIALAVEVLKLQGLDFKIGLNHIGIYNNLLAESGLSGEDQETVIRLILKKDLVGLERITAGSDISPDIRQALLDLPTRHGGAEIFTELEKIKGIDGVSLAVSELADVYRMLEHYGIQDQVVIDLGVLRGFDYYTGIIFEGYSPNLGYPLLGGGRYDNLLDKFGTPTAATGFAVGIERVLLALGDREPDSQPHCVVSGSDLPAVLAKARELREHGIIAEVDVAVDRNQKQDLDVKYK